MSRTPRALGALLLLLIVLLVPAAEALAAAGGGTSGFGGGGGGGGGGGFSGGGGAGGGGGGGIGFLVVVAIVLVVVLSSAISGWIAARKFKQRKRRREQQVRLAAMEAMGDDEAFDPDTLVPAARQLFLDIQEAWTAKDRTRLAAMVGPDLMVEWGRRLDDFDRKAWTNRVKPKGEVSVGYVGLRNREADEEDRACVLIEATMEDYVVDSMGHTITAGQSATMVTSLREYWTLGKRDGAWTLVSIEQLAEGTHNLDDELVTSPWSDSRVHDQAVIETAVADDLPEGFTPADVADLDFDGDARAAALDLSVADPRFAPDVLEAAARRAVEAWADAVDGDDKALLAVADQHAADLLLYGRDAAKTTRLVVRGPRVKRIAIEALDAGSDPATMTVSVELGGRRYTENRDTAAVVRGSKDRAVTFTERWTLALSGPDEHPWRLSAAPAAATSG